MKMFIFLEYYLYGTFLFICHLSLIIVLVLKFRMYFLVFKI